jgi:hypothetical protein
MTNYSVRFDRGNRGWTCSVFAVDAAGMKVGRSLADGTGTTQQAAKDAALSLASDAGIRAALASADPTRPHWVQGAEGERREAERKAAADRSERRTRSERLLSRES